LKINEDIMRFKTIRVEELDEEPSPILARRDREERRRARREGGRDGEDGGDFEGGED
jgi:small subunit ribosomal protein S6